MNERVFTVAAAQLAPILMDVDATLDKAIEAVHEAGRSGVRLLVFPEAFLAGYPFWVLHLDPTTAKCFRLPFIQSAIRTHGPELGRLAVAAREADVHVVMGFNERDGGTVYNSQVMISPSKGLVGKRRKLMPTFHERMVWGAGDARDVNAFETELGTIGALICFEHTNALYRYAMQAQNEHIHVAMWPGGISNIFDMMDAAVRHYAFEGQCFVVNATSINTASNIAALGKGGSLASLQPGGGMSGVVDPRGKWIARADPDKEEIVCAEINYDVIDEQKVFVDSMGHYARPDVLRLVVEPTVNPVFERADHCSDLAVPSRIGSPNSSR